jgi:hypothetical protein
VFAVEPADTDLFAAQLLRTGNPAVAD